MNESELIEAAWRAWQVKYCVGDSLDQFLHRTGIETITGTWLDAFRAGYAEAQQQEKKGGNGTC